MDQLEAGSDGKDLSDSVIGMKKDIISLTTTLRSAPYDELDEDIISQVRREEKREIVLYARAIMDYSPNGEPPFPCTRQLQFSYC